MFREGFFFFQGQYVEGVTAVVQERQATYQIVNRT